MKWYNLKKSQNNRDFHGSIEKFKSSEPIPMMIIPFLARVRATLI